MNALDPLEAALLEARTAPEIAEALAAGTWAEDGHSGDPKALETEPWPDWFANPDPEALGEANARATALFDRLRMRASQATYGMAAAR